MLVHRREALSAIAFILAAGRAAAAEPAPVTPLSDEDSKTVAQVVGYLESLTSAKGRFTQSAARGAEASGVFYLQRPGKARFDYDPPSGLQIASDGHSVTVSDRRLKTFRSYPLSMTPLGLFLARNIRLDRGVAVREVLRSQGQLTVVAEDAHGRNKGKIALRFSEPPLALTGWTVTDARGQQVSVRLEDFARSEPWPAAEFVLKDPRPAPADPGLAR